MKPKEIGKTEYMTTFSQHVTPFPEPSKKTSILQESSTFFKYPNVIQGHLSRASKNKIRSKSRQISLDDQAPKSILLAEENEKRRDKLQHMQSV